MKIVLFTATGAENLGDELITLCEIQSFGALSDIEITIFSHDIDRTKRFLLSQKINLENVTIKEYFPNGIKKHPIKNIRLFWETMMTIKNTDHVYVGGGGLLYSKNEEGHSPLRLWWMRAMMIKFFKKPLTYLSLGVSVGAKELRPYAAGIFDKAAISVRDKKSQETLETLGYKSSLLPDPVLTYEGNANTSKTIGIALRSGFLSDEILSDVIKKLTSLGYEIVLLPHSLHTTDENSHDGYYLQDFLFPGVITTQSIEQTLNMYQNCHIIISMRLHSMILAIDHRIPFVGISYSQKTNSLLSELNWNYTNDTTTTTRDILAQIASIEENYSNLGEKLRLFRKEKRETYAQNFITLVGK